MVRGARHRVRARARHKKLSSALEVRAPKAFLIAGKVFCSYYQPSFTSSSATGLWISQIRANIARDESVIYTDVGLAHDHKYCPPSQHLMEITLQLASLPLPCFLSSRGCPKGSN